MASYETRKKRDNGKTVTSVRVRIRRKGFKPVSETFRTKTEAEAWARRMEADMDSGHYRSIAEAKRRTVAELIDRYIKKVLPEKSKAMQHQAIQLGYWKDHIGHLRLADVDSAVITDCIDKLSEEETHYGKPRGPATLNRIIAAMRHAFSKAVEWGWLDDNPFRKVRKKQEPRGRVKTLTRDERDALIEACKQNRCPCLELIVTIALATGARRGEIIGLKWQDVNLSTGRLVFQNTKNKERRAASLGQHALLLLQQHAKVCQNNSDLVFPSPKDPSRPLKFRNAWTSAVKLAGLKDFHFHDLRHCAASYLAENGATLAEIAEILGHKTLAMVQRYAHLTETHTAKVSTNMQEKIFGEA